MDALSEMITIKRRDRCVCAQIQKGVATARTFPSERPCLLRMQLMTRMQLRL